MARDEARYIVTLKAQNDQLRKERSHSHLYEKELMDAVTDLRAEKEYTDWLQQRLSRYEVGMPASWREAAARWSYSESEKVMAQQAAERAAALVRQRAALAAVWARTQPHSQPKTHAPRVRE